MENEVLGLLITLHGFWTLIANNRRLPHKSLVLTSLLLVVSIFHYQNFLDLWIMKAILENKVRLH